MGMDRCHGLTHGTQGEGAGGTHHCARDRPKVYKQKASMEANSTSHTQPEKGLEAGACQLVATAVRQQQQGVIGTNSVCTAQRAPSEGRVPSAIALSLPSNPRTLANPNH